MKFSVGVDITGVTRARVKASADIAEFVTGFEHELEKAALTERLTHKYQNQTGHLQNSTGAGVVSQTDNEIHIDLEMTEEYALHIIKRGFSKFPDNALRAFSKINQNLAALERKAGKL